MKNLMLYFAEKLQTMSLRGICRLTDNKHQWHFFGRISLLSSHSNFRFLACHFVAVLGMTIIGSVILVSQERISVRGKVVSSEDQSAIVGASVIIVNTTMGTATDGDGKFSLGIPRDRKTISVSAVGYKSSTIIIPENKTVEITIALMPSLIQTQTIVVTANKRPQSLEEVPVSMNIIDAKMFEKRNIIALDDALRYVPGVNFQQWQINIRASSGYSRGVGSRVLMLVDGAPMLAGDTGEITFETIPVSQIDRVEVVKGAGSALYGSGALGGVINVLTKEIDEQPMMWWKLYGGVYSNPAYDQWKWSEKTRFTNGQIFGFSTTADGLGMAASLQRISDDGYREQDWLRRYNVFLKLKYDISPYQSIAFTSNFFQQYRGDFLWWKDLKNALRPADAQKNVTTSSLRFNNSVVYKHFVSEDFYYDVKAVHFRGNWHRDSLSTKQLDQSISDALVVDAQGNLTLNSKHILTFGIVGNAERVRSNIFGVHDGNGGAVYVQDEYSFAENISATVGLRHDVKQVIGLQTNQQTNPKFGLRYTLNELHTIRASVGSGFRTPSIGELYTSTRNTGSAAIVIPSVNLKPEHSWTYEISSTNMLSENLQLETAIFHSDFSNMIEPNIFLDTIPKINFRNITQARIQGMEASVLTNFFKRSLLFDMNYNYNWAIDQKTNTFLHFRPRHIASLNSEYQYEYVTFGMDYRFTSRIETIDNKLVELAKIKNGTQRVAIHIVDVRVITNVTPVGLPFRASLNVNNVFGYNYNELIGNVSPPRYFVLSFEGIIR